MADKEIRLVGSFKDDITPKLKKLSTQLTLVTKKFEKLQSKLRPIARDMGTIAMASERVSDSLKKQRSAFESSVQGMRAYKKELGGVVAAQKRLAKQVSLPSVRQPRGGGGGGGRGGGGLTGAAAAGTFLGGGALLAASGAVSVIGGAVSSAFGYLGDRFKEAMQDEINDIQAQGAIFGVLRKEGLVTDYKAGKEIAKTLDIEIAKMVASSPIPTETITTLNRTLSDTFLPGLMKGFKAEGASTMQAAQKSARQLAGFYEQIGYLTPPNYPIGMVTKGITKLIEAGKITGEIMQIDFFQMNPQLIPELRRRNFEQAKNVMERMKILQEAMNTVMPQEAIAEIRTSLTAGMQGLKDNLDNVSVGLLSFGAQFAKKIKVKYLYRDVNKASKTYGQIVEGVRMVETPLQMISAYLAPVLMELSTVIGAVTDKLGPVTQHIARAFEKFFGPALQTLTRELGGIADAINKGDLKDMGDILGKVVGNILKALSEGLEAIGDTRGPVGDFLKNFSRGLNSVFPPAAQARLARNLEAAFSNFLAKVIEFAVPPIAALLVTVAKSFVEGLFNSGPLGQLILAVGAIKGFISALAMAEAAQKAYAINLARMQAMAAIPVGAGRGLRGVAGPMPTAGGQQAMMAGGWLASLGEGFMKLLPALTKATIIITLLVSLFGGLESTLRQFSDFFGELFGSIGGGLEGLLDVIGMLANFITDAVQGILSLIPGIDLTANGFDLLKAVLVPITGIFQLVEMGLRGLVEGLANVRLWFAKTFTPWDTKKIQELEAGVREATAKSTASKTRIDVYNTAIRYGGAENYAKVLERDAAAKQRAVAAAETPQERARLNNELFALRQTLTEARKQAGQGGGNRPAPATTPGATGLTPAPTVPGAGGVSNPLPSLQALNVKQSNANALLTQTKAQIAASSNSQQARLREVTAAVNRLNSNFFFGMGVRVINEPTVRISNLPPVFTIPTNTPRRADGGSISANRMYMVGERGPELFSSSSAGRITPNGAFGGATVNVGTINVSGASGNSKQIAEEIAGELLAAMTTSSYTELYSS